LLSHLFFNDDSLKVIAATPLSRRLKAIRPTTLTRLVLRNQDGCKEVLPVSSDEMMLLAIVYHNVIQVVSIKREQELVLEYTYS
jgi:hypothetical protein